MVYINSGKRILALKISQIPNSLEQKGLDLIADGWLGGGRRGGEVGPAHGPFLNL